MFQEFPYTDMHQLNLDWIIKIAKDFLDQYTHIQQLIADGETSLQTLTTEGETSLQNLTTSGLEQLQAKADNLESLLQAWYDTHSADIAAQLASALSDLNSWYTTHQNYLDETLQTNITAFQTMADAYALETIQSIPQDYTALADQANFLNKPNVISLTSGYRDGYARLTDGTIANDNRFRCIEEAVMPGDIILYNASDDTYASTFGMCLYDADKTWTEDYYAESDTDQIIVVPEGVSYVIASFDNNYLVNAKFYIIRNRFNERHYDKNALGSSNYINHETGARTYDTRYKAITIPVYPGEVAVYNIQQTYNNFGMLFLTKNHTVIPGIAARAYNQCVIVPDNAYYIRATLSNTIDDIQLRVFSTNKTLGRTISTTFAHNENTSGVITVGPSYNDADCISILQALKETPADTLIIVQKGTYNIFTEYTNYYGATFWDDYDGYLNHMNTDRFYMGYYLAPGRQMIFEPGATINALYTGDNANVDQYFSVFSTAGSNLIDGVTIKYKNLRYAIHDDLGQTKETTTFRNIHFIPQGDDPGIGGGCGFYAKTVIENCVFDEYAGAENSWDINYHNHNGTDPYNQNEIIVRNCYGHRNCEFWSLGAATVKTKCFVSNSKFKNIRAYMTGLSTVENMQLIAWCNETDT